MNKVNLNKTVQNISFSTKQTKLPTNLFSKIAKQTGSDMKQLQNANPKIQS